MYTAKRSHITSSGKVNLKLSQSSKNLKTKAPKPDHMPKVTADAREVRDDPVPVSEFLRCPITWSLMKDPVVDHKGNSYFVSKFILQVTTNLTLAIINMFICMYVYMYICMYACMYVCMYVCML